MIYPVYSEIKIYDLYDVKQTISEMFNLAVKYKDDLKICENMNLYQFYLFLRDKVKYVKDPDGVEQVKRPLFTIYFGGDCDDKSVVAMAYFELKNYDYRLAITDYGKGFEHIYPEVKLNNRYVPFDTSCLVCDMGAERKYKRKEVFYKQNFVK